MIYRAALDSLATDGTVCRYEVTSPQPANREEAEREVMTMGGEPWYVKEIPDDNARTLPPITD